MTCSLSAYVLRCNLILVLSAFIWCISCYHSSHSCTCIFASHLGMLDAQRVDVKHVIMESNQKTMLVDLSRNQDSLTKGRSIACDGEGAGQPASFPHSVTEGMQPKSSSVAQIISWWRSDCFLFVVVSSPFNRFDHSAYQMQLRFDLTLSPMEFWWFWRLMWIWILPKFR